MRKIFSELNFRLNAPGKLSTWFPGEELLHRAPAPRNILETPLQTLIERISCSEMHSLLLDLEIPQKKNNKTNERAR